MQNIIFKKITKLFLIKQRFGKCNSNLISNDIDNFCLQLRQVLDFTIKLLKTNLAAQSDVIE